MLQFSGFYFSWFAFTSRAFAGTKRHQTDDQMVKMSPLQSSQIRKGKVWKSPFYCTVMK